MDEQGYQVIEQRRLVNQMGYYKKSNSTQGKVPAKKNETLMGEEETKIEELGEEIVEAMEQLELLNSTLFMYGYDHVKNQYINIDQLLKNNIADIKLYSGRTSTALEECSKAVNDEISKEMSMLLKGLLYCAPSNFTQQIVTNGEVRLQIE